MLITIIRHIAEIYILIIIICINKLTCFGTETNCAELPADPIDYNGHVNNVNVSHNLIHGGRPIDPPHKYPFVVTFEYMSKPYCGGALINQHYVLTAAHCLPEYAKIDEQGRVDRETIESLSIGVGVYNTSDQYQTIAVKDIIMGPCGRDSIIDIMLVKLDYPVTISSEIAPINIVSNATTLETIGTNLIFTGWGYTEKDILSDVLMETTLTLMTGPACNSMAASTRFTLCAGGPKTSPCSSDSGGPLFGLKGINYYLIGILSGGMACGVGPDRFTRVSAIKSWIEKNIDTSINESILWY